MTTTILLFTALAFVTGLALKLMAQLQAQPQVIVVPVTIENRQRSTARYR